MLANMAVEMTPLYPSVFGLPLMSDQDIELVKAAAQYLLAVMVFLLITWPTAARARVQFNIERSRLTHEILGLFETVYRKNGVVVRPGGDDKGEKWDLLFVLNSQTDWRLLPPEGEAPVNMLGERFLPLVAPPQEGKATAAVPFDALVSIEHLHLVSGIFRRIQTGLRTGTLRRTDLVGMWNQIMVWTYRNRLDFLTGALGASRREFTDVIGELIRAHPIHALEPRRPGRDLFYYLFFEDRPRVDGKAETRADWLDAIGIRARARLGYVRFFRARRSIAVRLILQGVDWALRRLGLF